MPNPSAPTIVFAGGGTGGHLYPAIAMADALRAAGSFAPAFVGSAERLETSIVPQAGYPLYTVASAALTRRVSPELARTVGANVAGVAQSLRLLARLQPAAVFATGGYVCFPVVLAARIRRTLGVSDAPIAALEPNARPGLTNRLLAPLVDEVWGAFDDAGARFAGKFVRTGVPVRAAIRELPDRAAAARRLRLDPERPVLLVMGGSQGARSVNDAIAAIVRRNAVPPEWQVLLIAGDAGAPEYRQALAGFPATVLGYVENLADAYAVADLVLARAGASTLAELAAAGKPAVLVPYPYAADDHQQVNAESYARTGAAFVLDDAALAGALEPLLLDLAGTPRLAEMRDRAQRLRGEDALGNVLARMQGLMQRKNGR